MAKRQNPDQKDMVNYQRPVRDIKQEIGDLLMEKYPPTQIEGGNVAMINTDSKVSFFFAGIKVEIKDEKCIVQDTSTESNVYREVGNRLLLSLLLEFIRNGNLDIKIKQSKRNR